MQVSREQRQCSCTCHDLADPAYEGSSREVHLVFLHGPIQLALRLHRIIHHASEKTQFITRRSNENSSRGRCEIVGREVFQSMLTCAGKSYKFRGVRTTLSMAAKRLVDCNFAAPLLAASCVVLLFFRD